MIQFSRLTLVEISVPANATATITPIDQINVAPSETPWAGDWQIDPCLVTFDPITCEGRGIPALPTATGWDDTGMKSLGLVPPTQTYVVVSSYIATIINIETRTLIRNGPVFTSAVGGDTSNGNERQPNTSAQQDINDTPNQPHGGPTEKPLPTSKPSDARETTHSSLLLEIVSQLAGTKSNVQPTPSSVHRTSISRDDSFTQSTVLLGGHTTSNRDPVQPEIMPSPDLSSAAVSTPAAISGCITLGSATLTLTPGLSTILGTNTDATLLAISTDAAGVTLVTISSSGVAVTATVSTVPTIVTLPKTGFEASITDVSRPADFASAVSTTSSEGAAAGHRKREVGSWMYSVLGIVGLFFGL